MAEQKPITITILNHCYQINCPPEAESELHHAAAYLNKKMMEIQKKAHLANMEHVAVMAALNIAHELLCQQTGKEASLLDISEKIEKLTHKLAQTLTKARIPASLINTD